MNKYYTAITALILFMGGYAQAMLKLSNEATPIKKRGREWVSSFEKNSPTESKKIKSRRGSNRRKSTNGRKAGGKNKATRKKKIGRKKKNTKKELFTLQRNKSSDELYSTAQLLSQNYPEAEITRDAILEADEKGTTLLHFACMIGSEEFITALVKLLEDTAPLKALANDRGESLLHYAVLGNNKAVAEYLLKKIGVDVDSRTTQNNRTPLFYACSEGFTEMAEILIFSGAKVNAQDNDNASPLHFACWEGHLEIVKLLVVYNAQ